MSVSPLLVVSLGVGARKSVWLLYLVLVHVPATGAPMSLLFTGKKPRGSLGVALEVEAEFCRTFTRRIESAGIS